MGMNPQWFAGTLFALTYLVVMSERINRAIVSLTAAGLMILGGVLTQEAALRGVDFNTLGLLTGMMVIVAVTRRSGIFQYLAISSAKRVQARPWGILVMLSMVTAVVSAFLDNVTTVLLIAPVTLLITEELKVSPYPYLFAEIFSSNIGGTATLIGDPPKIMIGSAAHLSFNDFLYHLAPAIVLIMGATLLPIYLIWGRHLHASGEDRARVMAFREREAITDVRLLKQCLAVLALVVLGFVLARPLHLGTATVAMFGAALLLLVHNLPFTAEEQSRNVHQAFTEVEWVTIFFFIGLFIVVHAVDTTGLLKLLAAKIVAHDRRSDHGHDPGDPVGLGAGLRGHRQHPFRRHHHSAHQIDEPRPSAVLPTSSPYGCPCHSAPVSGATEPSSGPAPTSWWRDLPSAPSMRCAFSRSCSWPSPSCCCRSP